MKFGGDALLLLFEGEDHPTRAALSAAQMRTTLGKVGQITTSVGAIKLRMSVGVHSGPVHLFRVGDSHRELLIAGPGPTGVVEMEQFATAGQIVISPGTATRIAPALVGEPAGPGYFLKARPRLAAYEAFPPPATRGIDLRPGVPVALRGHLGGAVEPEHRHVTVAFIRYDGIDAVIAQDGVEAAARALDELVRDVQAAVDAEGATFLGTDADKDGGKIIVVGGAPSSRDDDAGRVLRAMRRVTEGQRRLPIRIGVNQGHAFVGEVGPRYRRTYTIMGDTVNLAARLMASATSGEMRATGGVLDASATEFDLQPLPPFFVKGKKQPIEAFVVGAPVGRRERALTEAPFVGRDEILTTLAGIYEAARAGVGGLIDINGEAGIGKSRLVREAEIAVPDLPVITAFCETYEAETPYFAARYLLRGALGLAATLTDPEDALRAAVSAADPELLPWLPLIGAVVDINVAPTPEFEALEPRFLRDQTQRCVVDLLDRVLPPLQLFVVEDAQWIDDLSLKLVAAVAERARQRGWILAVVRRGSDELGVTPDTAITLPPLDDQAARALLQQAMGSVLLRPDQRDALISRASGNPLFLEQLAQAAIVDPSSAALSGSLESVVAAQIDLLPANDRLALRYAAVLGPMFESARLAELASDDSGPAARGAARRLSAFLEPAGKGWLRFRNQCYREVAYETLSFRRRKELHARAGGAIEAALDEATSDRTAILSFHFLHAQDYARCWKYALAAAESAVDKYANVEAVALYERALTAGAQLGAEAKPELAKTYEQLGRAALKAGTFERAKTAFARARSLFGAESFDTARICKNESILASLQGQPSNSVRWVNRGLKLIAERSDLKSEQLRADLRSVRAEQLQRTRRPREAIEWAELAVANAKASRDDEVLARAYTILDVALMDMGRLDEMTHLPDALAIWERLGNPKEQATVLTVLGAVAYYRGRWDDALEYFLGSRDAYLKAGDLVTAAYATCNMADILLDQGRAAAVEGVQEAIDLWRSVGHPQPVVGGLMNLGRAALEQHDLDQARAYFVEAKQTALDTGAAAVELDAWLAECLLQEGEGKAAFLILDDAIRAEEALDSTFFLPRLHRLRGIAYRCLGQTDDALADIKRSTEMARGRQTPYEIALALDALVAVQQAAGLPVDRDAVGERDEVFSQLGVRGASSTATIR